MMSLGRSPKKDKKKAKQSHVDHEENGTVEGKKKKKRKHENVGDEDHETATEELSESPIKKQKKDKGKKKSRRKRSHAEEEDEDDDSQGTNESLPSPRKKSKKNREASMNETYLSPSFCMPKPKEEKDSREMDKRILQLAMDQVTASKKANVLQLLALDYEVISEGVERERSAEECKETLKMLIEKTIKTKCLHQILCETLVELPNRMRRPSCYNMFISSNKVAIKEAVQQGRGTNKIAVASLLWKELSDAERAAYSTGTSSGHRNAKSGMTPFDVYSNKVRTNDPSVSVRDSRLNWGEMKISKKRKYIEQSVKIMKAREEEEGDEEDAPSPLKLKGSTKDDVDLYFKHLQLPEMPAKMADILYYKHLKGDNIEKNYLFLAKKSFQELSEKQRKIWTMKYDYAWKDYVAAVDEWKTTPQSETTLYLFDRVYPGSQKPEERDKKSKPSSKLKQLMGSMHEIEMPVGQVKFSGEPPVPPLTALQVYHKELEKKTKEKLGVARVQTQFKALEKGSKVLFKEKSDKIRSAYKHGLFEFVANMTEEQRKFFLGLRRMRFYRLLGEDIFEAPYPNKLFPVYIRFGGGRTRKRGNKGDSKKELKELARGSSTEDSSSDSNSETEERNPQKEQQKQVKMDSDSDSDSNQ